MVIAVGRLVGACLAVTMFAAADPAEADQRQLFADAEPCRRFLAALPQAQAPGRIFAVVLPEGGLTLRDQPAPDGAPLAVLLQGTIVEVATLALRDSLSRPPSDWNEAWPKVTLPDGGSGYVAREYLSADRPRPAPAAAGHGDDTTRVVIPQHEWSSRNLAAQAVVCGSVMGFAPADCPCEESLDRRGRSCRGKSAKLRQGRRHLVCPGDAEIKAFFR